MKKGGKRKWLHYKEFENKKGCMKKVAKEKRLYQHKRANQKGCIKKGGKIKKIARKKGEYEKGCILKNILTPPKSSSSCMVIVIPDRGYKHPRTAASHVCLITFSLYLVMENIAYYIQYCSVFMKGT